MGADFRSDTVTRPSAAMRAAILEAEVGDDVLDGDPTVRLLEEEAAHRLCRRLRPVAAVAVETLEERSGGEHRGGE